MPREREGHPYEEDTVCSSMLCKVLRLETRLKLCQVNEERSFREQMMCVQSSVVVFSASRHEKRFNMCHVNADRPVRKQSLRAHQCFALF